MFILFLRPEKGFVISVKYNTPFSSNYSIYFGYAALFSGETGAAFLRKDNSLHMSLFDLFLP